MQRLEARFTTTDSIWDVAGRDRLRIVPHVPVLPVTLLRLELLLQEPSIDLRAVADLVLGDVGAVVQLLRVVGEEFPEPEDRPERIEDCIASVAIGTWFRAMATSQTRDRHQRMSALTMHSREIAEHARSVAESLPGICAERAYMVGLLHEIAALPEVLGWQSDSETPIAPYVSSGDLTEIWSIPKFAVEAIEGWNRGDRESLWTSVLFAAHQMAGLSGDREGPQTAYGFASTARASLPQKISGFAGIESETPSRALAS